MKHVIAFALVLSTVEPVLAAHAQSVRSAAATPTGPRIEFAETVYNFGKVGPVDVLRHDFVVTNRGDALLEINDVKPACGCTMAGAWDRTIPPGRSGRIPIQFNPANFHGAVTKSITVVCNDPAQTTRALEIRAIIWRAIDVQPPYVYFTPVEGERSNDTRVVRITNHLDQPLALESPQCSNADLRLEMKTVQPGKEFELHVKYTGVGRNGALPSAITIKTSSPELPIISISANAIPQPAVAAMPSQITLPAGHVDVAYQHTQIIRNHSSEPLKLTEAAVNATGVAVEITEPEPGKVFRLNVSFPPNFQPPAQRPLALAVHTSDSRHPIITVPIRQAVPRPSIAAHSSGAAPADVK